MNDDNITTSFLAEMVYQAQLVEHAMVCSRTPANLYLPHPPQFPNSNEAELLQAAIATFSSIKGMMSDAAFTDAEALRVVHSPAMLELSCYLKRGGYLSTSVN